jgi:hypothetical protein
MSGLTLLLVWTASWLAPRSWQDVATASGKTPWRDRWLTWVYGPPRQRKALRTRLLAVNPFCWLASRSRFKPVWVWVFIAFVCGWWSYVHFYLHMEWNEEFFTLTTAVMLNSILKLWIAIEAGLRLAEDQKIGALELLLSTPLRASEIVAGQVLALRRQFLKPLVVVLVYEVVFTIAVSRHSYDSGPRAFAFGATNLILLLADIAAVTSVAMSSALTARSPNYASISTISRVLMLPWVVYGAIAVLVGMWSAMSSTPAPGWQFFLYLWFGLGLIADAAFGVPAWIQLRTRFRQLALRRFTNSAARPDA